MGQWLSPVLFTGIAGVMKPRDTCLRNNCPLAGREKRKGKRRSLSFLQIYLCVPAYKMHAVYQAISVRGTKSLMTISFPSVLTCTEIGGISDNQSVFTGLLGCQTLESCMWFTAGKGPLHSLYMAGATISPYCLRIRQKIDEPQQHFQLWNFLLWRSFISLTETTHWSKMSCK